MAGSYNRITIIGNVGRDPEMRAIPSGEMVTGFTVATTERSKNGDVTTWFRVSAFGKLAETCNQYLRKGSYVYIEGPLTQREYTDRDGATRQSLDVRAREMRMLDKAGDTAGGADSDQDGGQHAQGQGQGARNAWTQPQQSAPASDDMGDIPF
jgi:single-strand DNA-binding protein